MTTYIYTDGSAINNTDKKKRRAGSAFLVRSDNKDIYLSGYYQNDSTNNVAELMAVYSAYCWMRHHKNIFHKKICFKSDSEYLIKIFTKVNSYKANKELIEKIMAIETTFMDDGFNLSYKHVKAHTKKTDTDSIANALVDKTAKDCAKSGERIKKHFE